MLNEYKTRGVKPTLSQHRHPSGDGHVHGSATDQLTAAQKQLEYEQAAKAQAAEAQEAAVAAAARLERRVALLGQERDGLKRILASYQQDSTGVLAPSDTTVCADCQLPCTARDRR